MTEEVTDAMLRAGQDVLDAHAYKASSDDEALCEAYLAMRSASNSPTTNGEVSEPRQTHCADPDCTGPKPHVAETAGCKWGNPRAASDGVVERFIARHVTLREGKVVVTTTPRICDWQSLISAIAALSTPTKASAVDEVGK